jgi:hypothetical protein
VADRYWVGGSGSWNSTTKWSTTSGGSSGASVPTASDNVFFDANSGTAHYTVTVTDNATCANLTFTPEPIDGVTIFDVGVNFVIAGTFSTSGTQGNRRVWFRSSTYGLTRDMQIATIGTVTDVDFRDIRVTGAGGTLTGTRIGDLRGNVGITFSTPKNCFRIGTGSWSDNQWSDTSGGSPSTDFFPLAQDTAVFDESTTAGTHTMNTAIPYTGTVDMSARTTALTLSLGAAQAIYGNWTFGSGITISGAQPPTFSGRNTQVITSAGKAFNGSLAIDSYGGTVELADALSIGPNTLTVTNGTFDTKGYNVTANSLSSSNSNVREIKLGASTVTLSANLTFATSTNLTFDAGTSSITLSDASSTINGGNQTFYGVSFTSTSAGSHTINNANTFNSLSITAPSGAGLRQVSLGGDQTITGTLTAAGASAIRRVMLRSSAVGTTRTLTVGTLSADDCDFRDITIAGTAAGGSPTRAGNCGGNSGVTFPAPKTVYRVGSSTTWSGSSSWALTSGGAGSNDNFPLAQDTVVFDNTATAATTTFDSSFNVGTLDMSAQTNALTLSSSASSPFVYGDWTFGTGVTSSSTSGTITFQGRSTQTITSNGVAFGCPVTIACGTGTVQLADALVLGATRTLTHISGTFDAVSYNVTAGLYDAASAIASSVIKMGSGTWTISGTGVVWQFSSAVAFYKGTADILLSNTSTTARTFSGGVISYNKLTIGGATGTSTLTITGNNTFTELASTKTVAHTIALGTTAQTFGKWSVTGSAGNVVTLTGTGTSHILAGSCTDGIDYLAMNGIGFSAASPAEFYAGANSTGTAAVPVYRTAKPADSVRYWVGGTGNWNDTARWSTSSGGAGGASLPRSHDDVVFDSLSNATAYTATVNAITGGNRCKALTISGPLLGNVTLAGSGANTLIIHDDITLPATGLTRTYTGAIILSGSTSGKTITTNGVALASNITVDGVGAEWALADALSMSSNPVTVTNGAFDTVGYTLTCVTVNSTSSNTRTISFGASTVTCSSSPVNFGTTETVRAALTFNAGTSTITTPSNGPTLSGNNQTFYNVSFTGTGITTATINGANTFNDLSVAGRTSAGIANVVLSADQTINGTLTLSAGTNATMRTFVRSDTIGTTRTLTCAAVGSLTDIDFRDITIAGAAVSGGNLTGTRLGDCKGNSGITFDAAKTVYCSNLNTNNWTSGIWSDSIGGALDHIYFPLAQDTAVFPSSYPNNLQTITINAAYNIGTLDMSARTTNTMTLTCSQSPSIYGNWINGTGVTLTGTGTLTFAGRGSQTITSAGVTFTQPISMQTPEGSVTLQDALTTAGNNSNFLWAYGTFNANNFNVTICGYLQLTSVTPKAVVIGSGTWVFTNQVGSVWNSTGGNLTVTGTGIISLTSAATKSFAGGSFDYSGITLNQGGAGTLTVTGNNTFANITNSYSATGATTINFGTSTQRVSNFTATGEAGRVLTIQGTSATSPCTLIHTGAGDIDIDYVTITGVRAYPL